MILHDLTPEDLAEGLARDAYMLVDVREPHEFAMTRIADSVNVPLSSFNPDAVPDAGGRQVVLLCAAGVRSVHAAEIAQAFGKPFDKHLAGGLKAWAMAGLPLER